MKRILIGTAIGISLLFGTYTYIKNKKPCAMAASKIEPAAHTNKADQSAQPEKKMNHEECFNQKVYDAIMANPAIITQASMKAAEMKRKEEENKLVQQYMKDLEQVQTMIQNVTKGSYVSYGPTNSKNTLVISYNISNVEDVYNVSYLKDVFSKSEYRISILPIITSSDNKLELAKMFYKVTNNDLFSDIQGKKTLEEVNSLDSTAGQTMQVAENLVNKHSNIKPFILINNTIAIHTGLFVANKSEAEEILEVIKNFAKCIESGETKEDKLRKLINIHAPRS